MRAQLLRTKSRRLPVALYTDPHKALRNKRIPIPDFLEILGHLWQVMHNSRSP